MSRYFSYGDINRKNNFDILRYLFALTVIYSHSWVLLGQDEPGQSILLRPLSGYGVPGFFVISGYLVTKSWISDSSVVRFLLKRFLRIYPGLLAAILFSALVIGPLATGLPIGEYLRNPSVWVYIKQNMLVYPLHYSIADVFHGNPYPNAINGSLWSLPIEFTAYIAVLLLGVTGAFRERRVVILLLLGLFSFETWCQTRTEYSSLVVGYMLIAQVIQLMIFFLIGSTIYLYREKVPVSIPLLMLSLAICLFASDIRLIFYFSFSYLVYNLAYAMPVVFNINKFGDFSYGLYVYAFPVQQLLISLLFRSYHPLWLCLISTVATAIVSVVSWHFIEGPCLRLRKKLFNVQAVRSANREAVPA
ncbi:MAG: acyltransferase [bacterium]|nr:acyltransferase [bacterium]